MKFQEKKITASMQKIQNPHWYIFDYNF